MADLANQTGDQAGAMWTSPNQPVHSPVSDGSKKAQEQALNRACEACRVSKVRCLVDPEEGSTQCQRCAKAGRRCVFAPPAKRRQRKRTDVRVTELEKEIQQMRSLLKTNNRGSDEASDHESGDESSDDNTKTKEKEPSSRGCSRANTASSNLPPRWPLMFKNSYVNSNSSYKAANAPQDFFAPPAHDIIERGLVTQELAEELLSIWRNELVNACPGISLPRDWRVSDLRTEKPLLFHAVMAAAAHSKGSELSDKLHEAAVYLYAYTIFIVGEKSVQAIQALLVTVTYYSPPRIPGQLQIYQWMNTAASMALELGLASKPRTHEQLPKRAIKRLQKISSPEELLEHCRTVLLLYTLSAGFSMRFKRPNILLFNSWMQECYIMLEKSNLVEDKQIIAYLRLQRIADETNTAFGFDDASTSFSLSELRMQIILRIFDRRMLDWKKSTSEEAKTLFATIEYHQNILQMWEFGMDGGRYDVTEFKNQQFSLPALDDSCVQPESLLSQSALQINATAKCISAAQSILECFSLVSIENLQKASNVIFVRAVYSIVVLMKADYAVGTDVDMSELLGSEHLKVNLYLDMALSQTRQAIGQQKCRIPSHWAFVLEEKLKSWWDEYQEWRKTEPHLKRRKITKKTRENVKDGNQVPAFAMPKVPERSTTYPSLSASEQSTTSLPNYGTNNSYPAWNTNDPGMEAAASAQPISNQTSFLPVVGDFSSVFQNGDLYLWDSMNADSFAGWAPQGELFGGMGFGSTNDF